MIAAIQMYDWPEVRPRTDTFWARVRAALQRSGVDAPIQLSRPDALSAPWSDPSLLVGQTCGLPYVSGRCGEAVLVGRPCFGVAGGSDGTYASALVCRSDEIAPLESFRGRRAAINEFGSQSGCNALADAVCQTGAKRDDPFFSELVISGAHRNSASMVAENKADIAAIDGVAWSLFEALEPAPWRQLAVIGWTRPMPAIPFITSIRNAKLVPDLLSALQTAASPSTDPGLPHAVLAANDSDYAPIRSMADRVRGMILAPGARAI